MMSLINQNVRAAAEGEIGEAVPLASAFGEFRIHHTQVRLQRLLLQRGESLAEAIKAEKGMFPPLYAAMVEAGVRSGNLSAALEGLGKLAL